MRRLLRNNYKRHHASFACDQRARGEAEPRLSEAVHVDFDMAPPPRGSQAADRRADSLTERQKESLTAKRRGSAPFLLLSFSSATFPRPPDPLQFNRANPALKFHGKDVADVKRVE
ncbi:hypothetical protein EYF80_038144 [Liparis tanakae]|uniref:Uncharacterized protein n=1 Tax=Liparis tanakae TaxID=230148 RepID=A0A4Z2GDL0_9TELE|nr:hypothetical protein EYF80_038144 [Liparis tanakae]